MNMKSGGYDNIIQEFSRGVVPTYRKAIVTLAIGVEYKRRWYTLCARNWARYGARHGYDIICIDKPLDYEARASRRSPSWQKCLILSQDFAKNYDRIIYIDADIIINSSTAPDIAADVPISKVVAVDEWAQPTPELHAQAVERQLEFWREHTLDHMMPGIRHYTSFGLMGGFDQLVQAGVLVLSPAHHRKILKYIYNT